MTGGDADLSAGAPQSLDDREECMAVGCEKTPVEIHIPVDGAVEYEPHALCQEHSRMTKNKVRDIGADSAGGGEDGE